MSKTETSRTDIEPPPYAGFDSCVPRDFARTLERELSAAQNEVERLKEDAARYRWLRDARYTAAPSGSLVEMWLFSRPTASGAEIDLAIDAARRFLLDNPAEGK